MITTCAFARKIHLAMATYAVCAEPNTLLKCRLTWKTANNGVVHTTTC